MRKPLFTFSLLYFGCFCFAQTTITIQSDKKLAAVLPAMWGLFFEDINFGADQPKVFSS